MNEAEQRFAGYLDDHGYQWKFEPDYRTEFALDARLRTNPDFLVSRDSVRAVCEVRQFETDGIYGALAGTTGVGSLDSKTVYGPLRSALVEKAEQLRPFARLHIPLIIALANPLQAGVILDEHHVPAAMFGNSQIEFSVDSTGAPLGKRAMRLILEDYGVFRSPVWWNGQIAGWQNRHPHVSAVLIVRERLVSTDWREEIVRSIPAADQTLDAAHAAAFRALTTVNELVRAGEEPTGSYRFVDVYDLEQGPACAVPPEWFIGAATGESRSAITVGMGSRRRAALDGQRASRRSLNEHPETLRRVSAETSAREPSLRTRAQARLASSRWPNAR